MLLPLVMSFPVDVPVKLTVLVALLYVEPDIFQLPLSAKVDDPATTVPALNEMSPVTVMLEPCVRKVPPFMRTLLLNVKLKAELCTLTVRVKPDVNTMDDIETLELIAASAALLTSKIKPLPAILMPQ